MILLKNGLILDGENTVKRDILIEGEKIVEIKENIEIKDGFIVKDVNENLVIPAGVDVHAHLREPGYEHKETVKTGTLSAAKGGIATIITMPNLKPVPDNLEKLKVQKDILDKDSCIRAYISASVSIDEKGEQISDIKNLNDKVVCFTDDGLCVNNLEVLENAMKLVDKPIASHAEARGAKTAEDAEIIAVQRELELLRKYKHVKYHFCHLSCEKSFELVKSAKDEGLDVTCEVMPHHLFLNKSQIKDANWKMNPPLRSESDRIATIKALKSGIATMIATDHAPHSREEKSREYDKCPNGIIGFETMFPLVYTYLVKTGEITLKEMVEWTSENPAKRFNLPYGEIKVGGLADIAVLDIKTEREYTEGEILSKSVNTPFIGFKLVGYPVLTLVGGKTVYDNLK